MSTHLLEPADLEPDARELSAAIILRNAVLVCCCVALAARISVPMPDLAAPFTLQSLAVVLAGPLAGARGSVIGMLLYLGAGALGVPVFANGASGVGALTGATAGFLWTFVVLPVPLALMARRVDGGGSGLWFGAFLGAHLALLAVGFIWMLISAAEVGGLFGWLAFVPGMVLKSMLAVLVLRFTPPRVTRSARKPSRIEAEAAP